MVAEPAVVEAAAVADPLVVDGSMTGYRFEVFEDSAGEWRWRLVAPNAFTIADSGEAYASRSNALRAARRLKVAIYRAVVE